MSGGPRTVTLEQIEAEIASEWLFTADDGVLGSKPGIEGSRLHATTMGTPLHLLTFCVLVLKNGHKVVGINYGAIDPTTHSAEMGREDARQDARNKVRDYLGFRLRDQIAAEQGAAPAAKRYEREDLDLNSLKWATLPAHEDPFRERVSYVVNMRDGKQLRRVIRLADDRSDWPASRVVAACVLDALRVANGEAQ